MVLNLILTFFFKNIFIIRVSIAYKMSLWRLPWLVSIANTYWDILNKFYKKTPNDLLWILCSQNHFVVTFIQIRYWDLKNSSPVVLISPSHVFYFCNMYTYYTYFTKLYPYDEGFVVIMSAYFLYWIIKVILSLMKYRTTLWIFSRYTIVVFDLKIWGYSSY